ncbi:hypothetical protein [Fibrobacter sp.]|uniref:hypothetical protein n=1 Tax=Fibrobacter sp. TaxID=35828 RepID=UPI00388FD16E
MVDKALCAIRVCGLKQDTPGMDFHWESRARSLQIKIIYETISFAFKETSAKRSVPIRDVSEC